MVTVTYPGMCLSQEESPARPLLEACSPYELVLLTLALCPCPSPWEMGMFGVLSQLHSVLAVRL